MANLWKVSQGTISLIAGNPFIFWAKLLPPQDVDVASVLGQSPLVISLNLLVNFTDTVLECSSHFILNLRCWYTFSN